MEIRLGQECIIETEVLESERFRQELEAVGANYNEDYNWWGKFVITSVVVNPNICDPQYFAGFNDDFPHLAYIQSLEDKKQGMEIPLGWLRLL